MDDAMVRQKLHQLTRTGSHRRQGSFRSSSKRKNKNKNKQNGDNEHPGPIFLGNVVNRQYRYRWVLFGVVLFVCMVGVVILSVVYANV